MATTISSLQPDLFTTPIDVRILNEIIQSQTENSKILADNSRLLWAIFWATDEVRTSLYRTYPGDSYLEADAPYCSPVLVPKYNEHSGVSENTGSATLYGIVPSSSAETELWTITFSSASAFSVTGSRSGSQGSGTKGVAFTSTNTWISIPADVFSGTPANEDIFYVAVYKHYQLIVYLTSLVAASIVHNGLFNFLAPNETPITDRFRQEANRLIKNLNNGYDFSGTPFRLPSFSIDDRAEIANPFYIDRLGLDISNYSDTEEPSIITGDVSPVDCWWWR